ncbi:MAG: lipopolysaccharide biosynthesis protein [Prevotella sp.]|jgi:O-antigen/teichoic acid export membrane protein|nr:lipopolysaccharide biosynthesis protein [Prevotella sp.]
MAETTLKEKTAKGIFWGGISNFVQQAIGAVFGIVIARLLSPGDYGLVGMLSIFTVLGNTICESGFTTALTNRKEIKKEDYNAVFWFSLTAGVVMYLILFFCAPFISRFYGQPELMDLSRLVFLNFMLNSAGTAHFALMFKKLMVKERAKIDITAISISGLVGLILALNGFAYWGLALQTLSFTTVSVILRWHYSQWRPTLNVNIKPLREMFWFSFKLFLTNIFMQISSNIFSVLLGKFYDEKQVGYYSQGNKWMMLGSTVIGGMITSVAQPIFVESKEDRGRLLMIFRKMLRFGAFVSFPTMLGLAFIGEEFIAITIGDKWLESVPFLQLLCIWGAAGYIWYLYVFLLMSMGKSNIYLYGCIAICLLQLVCAAFLFPFGIYSMLIAYVVCYFIGICIWHYFVNKLIGIRLWHVLKDLLPYLLITAVCFSVAWSVSQVAQSLYLRAVLKITVAVVIYILIMKYSLSTIFRESLLFLTNRCKKYKL